MSLVLPAHTGRSPPPLIVAVAFSFADIRGKCDDPGEADLHKADKAAFGLAAAKVWFV